MQRLPWWSPRVRSLTGGVQHVSKTCTEERLMAINYKLYSRYGMKNLSFLSTVGNKYIFWRAITDYKQCMSEFL